jgi:hypothetical protein
LRPASFSTRLPLGRIDRGDRQPVAALQDAHAGKLRVRAQFGKRDESRLRDQRHVDVDPAWRFARGLRIVVGTLAIELRRVGIGLRAHFDDAGDPRLRAARVVEERAIAEPHLVAHEVARLVVTHAEPRRGSVLRRREVVDREFVRLGFEQPVTHRASVNVRRCSLMLWFLTI